MVVDNFLGEFTIADFNFFFIMEKSKSRPKITQSEASFPKIGIPVDLSDPHHVDPSIQRVNGYLLKQKPELVGHDFNSKPVREVIEKAPENIQNMWRTVQRMYIDTAADITFFVTNIVAKNETFLECLDSGEKIRGFCDALRQFLLDSSAVTFDHNSSAKVSMARKFLEQNALIVVYDDRATLIDKLEKQLLRNLDDLVDMEIAAEINVQHPDDLKKLGSNGIFELIRYLRARFIGIESIPNPENTQPEIFAISKTIEPFVNNLPINIRGRVFSTLSIVLREMLDNIPGEEEMGIKDKN